MINKRTVGFVLGIIVFLVLYFIPIDGLTKEGQTLLALLLMTVVFWACQIVQPGYAAGIFVVLCVVLKVGEPVNIFASWTGTTMWLVVGAYIIAAAVTTSGLGERIAYAFVSKFVSNYRSLIISIFVLSAIMSLLIPHPIPKALLIMSVVKVLMDSCNMPAQDRVKVGFGVFAAAVPTSMLFLTGDSSFNPLILDYAQQVNPDLTMGWLQWLQYMIVPALAMIILTMILYFIMFKPSQEITVNKAEMQGKLKAMGGITQKEVRTIIWLVIAIILWLTDSKHHINAGWVTLGVAMILSMPIIGEVITPKEWSSVPMQTLMFLTAALAIGKLSGAVEKGGTGLGEWLFNTLLPSSLPANIFLIALIVTAIAMACHMVLGSCIAVMSLAGPVLIPFVISSTGGASSTISALVPAFIVYTAIYTHYIFPYQNLPIVTGAAESAGGYTSKETIKMGIPLIVVVFIVTVIVEVLWFKLMGLC